MVAPISHAVIGFSLRKISKSFLNKDGWAGGGLSTNSTWKCGFSKENPTKQFLKNTINAHSEPKKKRKEKEKVCINQKIPIVLLEKRK